MKCKQDEEFIVHARHPREYDANNLFEHDTSTQNYIKSELYLFEKNSCMC